MKRSEDNAKTKLKSFVAFMAIGAVILYTHDFGKNPSDIMNQVSQFEHCSTQIHEQDKSMTYPRLDIECKLTSEQQQPENLQAALKAKENLKKDVLELDIHNRKPVEEAVTKFNTENVLKKIQHMRSEIAKEEQVSKLKNQI